MKLTNADVDESLLKKNYNWQNKKSLIITKNGGDLLYGNSHCYNSIQMSELHKNPYRPNQYMSYENRESYSCCVLCIVAILIIIFVASTAKCIYYYLSDFL